VTDDDKGRLPRTFDPAPIRESERIQEYISKTPWFSWDIPLQDERKTGQIVAPTKPMYWKRIAITGTMHSGKTTLANILVRHGYNRQTFAGPVKDMAAAVLNTLWVEKAKLLGSANPWSDLTTADLEQNKGKYRPLYQFIGAYGREVFGEDVWVRSYQNRYQDRTQESVVCDDMRYLNEAAALDGRGYLLVRMYRPEKDRIRSIKEDFEWKHGRKMKKAELKAILTHESETEVPLIACDHEVVNDGTIANLENAAIQIMGGTINMAYTKSQKERGDG
jgi:hypothetical protein